MNSTTLLTSEESAEKLGIKPRTLVRWRGYRKGPAFVKVGRSVRYRQEDLDAWVASRRVEVPAPAPASDKPLPAGQPPEEQRGQAESPTA